jgi:putative transposase
VLQGEYRIGDLSAAFLVSRSGYYRWRTAPPSRRAGEDAFLSEQLRALHAQSEGTYGRPRLPAALRQRPARVGPKRVARLLRALGLRGVQCGRFRPRTTQSADRTPAPNLLRRRQTPTQPARVWVADLTFVPTQEGWLYTAAVMDQASPPHPWPGLPDSRLDSSLCAAALRQALSSAPPQAGLIHLTNTPARATGPTPLKSHHPKHEPQSQLLR